jgi:hypothetical protein
MGVAVVLHFHDLNIEVQLYNTTRATYVEPPEARKKC